MLFLRGGQCDTLRNDQVLCDVFMTSIRRARSGLPRPFDEFLAQYLPIVNSHLQFRACQEVQRTAVCTICPISTDFFAESSRLLSCKCAAASSSFSQYSFNFRALVILSGLLLLNLYPVSRLSPLFCYTNRLQCVVFSNVSRTKRRLN